MALLDRFRSQPALKHPDPEVRLAFVEGLSIDEKDLLLAAAREDASPRVRRAAVGKLIDPAALALVAHDDSDAAVRTHAAAMLRDIAVGAFEETSESDSLAAVDALSDGRMLAHVAKTAASEPVAERALARIAEPRAWGSVARHAVVESVRRAALQSLSEREDLVAVAMNSTFKDTAVGAVERLSERADLEQIAERSANRNAVKRARQALREMDDRAAADAGADRSPAPDASSPDGGVESAPVDPGDDPADPGDDAAERALARRQEAAVEEGREVGARTRAEADAARDREEHLAAERVAAAAVQAEETERKRERMATLVAALEAAAVDPDLKAARRAQALVHREWGDLPAAAADADLLRRYAEADSRLAGRDQAARETDRRARQEALAQLHERLRRAEALAARSDATAKAIDRTLRDVRGVLGAMPALPSKQDYDEVMARLKGVHAALAPKLQELREMEEWQRWANVGIQEQLCEKMEALKFEQNPEEVVHRVRDLQQQWRLAADVPRARVDALWQRFKTAHDQVWALCEAHFAADAERRADNLRRKIALCERAEALSDSTRWVQTAEELKALQAEWKTIGPVSRGQEKTIWDRFRTACDRFFTRRHEDLSERKAAWAENLAKKDALSAQAEALAQSTDWDVAAAEIKRLQAEWKTIGPVKKSRSEAVWQRFRTACDAFFARYAQRHDIARGERVAAREAICAELESLPAPGPDEGGAPAAAPPDLLARVRELQSRWQEELGRRGVEPARAAALDQRFAAAFEGVLTRWPDAFANTDLDRDANRRKMEALVARVEEVASSLRGQTGGDALSPTVRLAAMLKEALAANTIGGKVDPHSRLRAAQDDLRRAQASWSRIGPVPEPTRRALADRFTRAARAITEAGRTGETAQSAKRP